MLLYHIILPCPLSDAPTPPLSPYPLIPLLYLYVDIPLYGGSHRRLSFFESASRGVAETEVPIDYYYIRQ